MKHHDIWVTIIMIIGILLDLWLVGMVFKHFDVVPDRFEDYVRKII